MAYRDFTLEDLQMKFGVASGKKPLFKGVKLEEIQISEWLKKVLSIGQTLPLRTEKAKSEAVVSPILFYLKDLNNDFLMMYSGEVLKVDRKLGLNGECDFLLARNTGSLGINLPMITVVEAKKGELDLGIEQCAAQMYGVMLFNQKMNKPLDVIYGCVTNGREWQFMRLEGKLLHADEEIYTLKELPTILGIFQHIIDYYKAILEPVEA